MPAELEHDTSPASSEGAMRCPTHPQTETYLSCGRCGKPICPQCLVHTPVGARCKKCANVRPNPVYHVSTTYLLRAIGAAVGLAVGGGIVWAVLRGIPFVSFFVAIGVGIAIGEGISRVTNRKRGRGLQIIAGVSVVASFFIGQVFRGAVIHNLPSRVLDDYVFSIDVFMVLALVIGVMYAVGRLR